MVTNLMTLPCLQRAMIHSSYANEKHLPKYECNERLEFLGDAVLDWCPANSCFTIIRASGRGTYEDEGKYGM